MTELILRHEDVEYRTELCKIIEVSTDPYNFRVRLGGINDEWSMLFAVVNLENGHQVMKDFKKALTENFNTYGVEDIKGKFAFLLKEKSGNIVGIASASTYFYKEPVFREPLGV
jgi:hypothetical protein